MKTDSVFVANSVNLWIPQWRQNGWKKNNGKTISNIDDIMKLSNLLNAIEVSILNISVYI